MAVPETPATGDRRPIDWIDRPMADPVGSPPIPLLRNAMMGDEGSLFELWTPRAGQPSLTTGAYELDAGKITSSRLPVGAGPSRSTRPAIADSVSGPSCVHDGASRDALRNTSRRLRTVDPGRYTDTELRSWGAAHEWLWRALRLHGIEVQVVVIGADYTATIRAEAALKTWSSRAGEQSSQREYGPSRNDPDVQAEIKYIETALNNADTRIISKYGGGIGNLREIDGTERPSQVERPRSHHRRLRDVGFRPLERGGDSLVNRTNRTSVIRLSGVKGGVRALPDHRAPYIRGGMGHKSALICYTTHFSMLLYHCCLPATTRPDRADTEEKGRTEATPPFLPL